MFGEVGDMTVVSDTVFAVETGLSCDFFHIRQVSLERSMDK